MLASFPSIVKPILQMLPCYLPVYFFTLADLCPPCQFVDYGGFILSCQ